MNCEMRYQPSAISYRLSPMIAAAVVLAGCRPAPSPQAAAEGHRVQINAMQMYYEVSGAGDPLIVLHGAYMNIPSMGASAIGYRLSAIGYRL